MNAVSAINLASFGSAVALSLALAASAKPPAAPAPIREPAGPSGTPRADSAALLDASGHPVPLRPYRRILSTSAAIDQLLFELCEPDRIRALSAAGVRNPTHAFRYAGKPTIDGLAPVEAILALAPDLVLANRHGLPAHAARLRAAGVEVFDLGELRGIESLGRMADAVARLVGHPERGVRLAQALDRRMRGVAAHLGAAPRPSGMYVSPIGPRLLGGTAGTSYHDVLEAAGLRDAAAERFRDWPDYSAEQVLALAPDLIVTKLGQSAALCAHPGLDRLAACREPARIIELPAGVIDDAGPGMLAAAERLHALAYPRAPAVLRSRGSIQGGDTP